MMIIKKKESRLHSTQSILAEKKQWLKNKKRLENQINHQNSGMFARWFDQDCYWMDKYFEEKLNKASKRKNPYNLEK